MALKMFETRIRHISLTLSPFSAQQMSDIGQIALDSVISRIRQAVDANDGPAPALAPAYARRKIIRNRAPVRDWTWRGKTLRSAKVKVASEDRVTIGFVDAEADLIATVQNRRAKQWAISPRDKEVIDAAFTASLRQKRVITFRRTA